MTANSWAMQTYGCRSLQLELSSPPVSPLSVVPERTEQTVKEMTLKIDRLCLITSNVLATGYKSRKRRKNLKISFVSHCTVNRE